MTLSTHPEDRREMVRALSERLQTPAIYLRTPTYACLLYTSRCV